MPDKVLIYSRFPKALMARIGAAFRTDGRRRQAADRGLHGRTAFRRARADHGRRHAAGGGGHGHAAIACARSSATAPAMTASILRPQRKRNIAVGHSPAANAAAVADLAVTLMLAVTRRLLAGRRIRAQRQLGRGQTFAADAAAARQSRPPRRHLRHGRDRPQDRRARRRVRDRSRLFQPQPARRALSISAEP